MSGSKQPDRTDALQRLKPYAAYKDSGVEWLGEIPAHWTAKHVRQVCSRVTDGAHISPDTSSADFPFVSTVDIRGGAIDFDGCLRTSDASHVYMERTGCRPKDGDVLFSKDGTVGTTAVVTTDRAFAVASSLVILSPDKNEVDARWLNHWLTGVFVKEQVELLLSGAALRRISVAKVGRLPVLLPPKPDEQRAIAAFLDRETARIDALVAKKEQLIELLQEKRTALITRAVTKGLDPTVPMKDSGVEWLGEIPAHWEVSKMWRISSAISGGTPTKEQSTYWGGEIPWVSPKDMKRRFIDSSEDTITDQALRDTGLKLVPPPAVLIVVRGMILAHSFPVALTRVPVTINQDMKALRLRRDIAPLFLAWLFEGIGKGLVAAVVEEAAHGTRPIRMDQWRSVTVAVPPESEQRALVAFLDRETARIDALVAKVRDAIDRLRELRTALISAAVTGKIDVRAA